MYVENRSEMNTLKIERSFNGPKNYLAVFLVRFGQLMLDGTHARN